VTEILTADGLDAALRRIGAERYHNLHPFHRLLHGGRLNKGQVQAWALNRYCYQSAIPRKDAALIARAGDSDSSITTATRQAEAASPAGLP
jgi:pyrroloquinoline-quinone synthase